MYAYAYVHIYNSQMPMRISRKNGGFLMKRKATRLLATLLCVIMLVSTMIIPLSAAGNKGGLGSIADVSEILNALSYAEYRKNYLTAPKGEGEIIIDASDDVNCLVKEDTTADYKVVDWQGKESVHSR